MVTQDGVLADGLHRCHLLEERPAEEADPVDAG
jgi:hypothetical protein